MSEVKSRKTKGASSKGLGENKVGLKATIPFGLKEAKIDLDEDSTGMVDIKVNVDTSGDKTDQTNITSKRFVGIDTFNRNGAAVILTIKSLNYDIYAYKGLLTPLEVEKKLKFLQRVLVGHSARDSYLKIFITCRDAVIEEYEIKSTTEKELKSDSSKFFAYLRMGDVIAAVEKANLSEAELIERKKLLVTGDEYCANFERHFYFKMGKLLWHEHRSV